MPLPLHRVEADGLSYCSILAKESAEVAEELIQLKVVHGLMVAVGNLDYPLSQRNASISLEVSVMVCNHSIQIDDIIACGLFPEHLNRNAPCTVLVRFLFVSEHSRQTSQRQE